MNTTQISIVNFGNWVSLKFVIVPAVLGAVLLALGLVHWVFLVGAGLFFIIAGYFGLARYLFSSRGASLQDRVLELVIGHVGPRGSKKILDVGCGSGSLTIRIARHCPEAEVIGIDSWGAKWEYSHQMCINNARASGVGDRVTFRQGSASSLPFEDASFDLVVSNLVFHEIGDVKNKLIPLREAFRVLKPGGSFVHQDLFLLKPYYGTPEDLVETVRGWGVREVEFQRTCDEAFIPRIVKLPFMLGALALLRGTK